MCHSCHKNLFNLFTMSANIWNSFLEVSKTGHGVASWVDILRAPLASSGQTEWRAGGPSVFGTLRKLILL